MNYNAMPPLDLNQKVTVIDPGGDTGIVWINNGEILTATLPVVDLMDALASGLWRDFPTLVVENFLIYPWKAKELAFDECISAQLIGAIKLAARISGQGVVLQNASEAKSFAKDELLQHYGLLDVCKTRHERDAARHACYYLVKQKQNAARTRRRG